MVNSILTVTSPAPDRNLLDIRELRKAVDVSNAASDVDLKIIGLRISGAIAGACRVVAGGQAVPTLRRETLTETFRLSRHQRWNINPHRAAPLLLSRRPIASVTSVTADGSAIAPSDYEIDAASGLLYSLSSDSRVSWCSEKVVVVYDAGFDEVPEDLKLAASRLAAIIWNAGSQDTNIKSEFIQDIGRTEYFGNVLSDGALPGDVMELLAPYINFG